MKGPHWLWKLLCLQPLTATNFPNYTKTLPIHFTAICTMTVAGSLMILDDHMKFKRNHIFSMTQYVLRNFAVGFLPFTIITNTLSSVVHCKKILRLLRNLSERDAFAVPILTLGIHIVNVGVKCVGDYFAGNMLENTKQRVLYTFSDLIFTGHCAYIIYHMAELRNGFHRINESVRNLFEASESTDQFAERVRLCELAQLMRQHAVLTQNTSTVYNLWSWPLFTSLSQIVIEIIASFHSLLKYMTAQNLGLRFQWYLAGQLVALTLRGVQMIGILGYSDSIMTEANGIHQIMLKHSQNWSYRTKEKVMKFIMTNVKLELSIAGLYPASLKSIKAVTSVVATYLVIAIQTEDYEEQ